MKNDADLANLFAGFAHPTRIAVLRCLLKHCLSGRRFGELAGDLGVSPSTLKHHLDEMHRAGVLARKAQGRATILRLDMETLAQAAAQLSQMCCAAEEDPQLSQKEPDA